MPDIDRFSLFTEARERLGHAFARGLGEALPEVATALARAADDATSIVGRRRLTDGAASLRLERDERVRRALARLYDLTFRMLEANQSAGTQGEPPLLALMADDELDHQILADEVAGAVRERLGAAYDVALRRVDTLTGTGCDDARAPMGATVLAAAALDALSPMTGDRATRGVVRSASIAAFAPRLAEAIASTDLWLAERGVEARLAEPVAAPEPEPEAEPEPVAAPEPVVPLRPVAGPVSSGVRVPMTPDVPRTEAPEAVGIEGAQPEETHPDASHAGASHAEEPHAQATRGPESPVRASPQPVSRATDPVAANEPVGAPEAVPTAGTLARTADALEAANEVAEVLGRQPVAPGRPEAAHRQAGSLPRPDALEQDAVAFAHHVGVAPYTREARQRFFDALRTRMRALDAAPGQLAALDLIAGLFDYVVDDIRMPEAAQPLLWRLQHPAVTLAALDAGYLGDDRRSIRRLVEHLAAISVAYADDIVQGSELYRRLETVVRAVEVVAHAFQSRSVVLGDQVRKEYVRAAQGVSQIVAKVAKERTALDATPGRRNRRDYSRRPSRDREQTVTRRIERELQDRLDRHDVPESVREFLLGVWLRHLRTAVLRDGEGSSAYRLALHVVDDLLWSLDAAGPRPSRSQLASRIPPLIKLLTQGVSDSGAKPEEFRPFLDELFLIHLRKMQRGPRDGGPSTRTGPVADEARADAPSTPVDPLAVDDDGLLPTLDETIGEAPGTGPAIRRPDVPPAVPATRAPPAARAAEPDLEPDP
ncbi:MAG: DUF1631 family protein, partial [Burkholderiales bacterium]